MLEKSRDIVPQRVAWVNYRGRLCETLSLLRESLIDADNTEARNRISRQIACHAGHLQRADKRIAELSATQT